MPTYGFECTLCGDRFEVFLSLSENQPRHCKKCNGKLEKVFYPVGIMFKGSGFYVNDNRSSAKNSAARPVTQKPALGNGSSAGKSSDSEISVSGPVADKS